MLQRFAKHIRLLITVSPRLCHLATLLAQMFPAMHVLVMVDGRTDARFRVTGADWLIS